MSCNVLPFGLRDHYFDLERLRIHAVEGGSGKPVLLVHGAASSWRDFAPQVVALSRCAHVWAVDLRGHGDTLLPPDRDCSMEAFYLDLLEFIAASPLQGQPFALAGHSFGGYLAARYASEYPENISRLALLNTAGELPHGIAFRFLRRCSGNADTWKKYLPWLVTATSYVSSELLKRSFAKWHCWDLYPKIKADTMVILGTFDPLIPLGLGRKMASLIPHSHLKIICDGGHISMNEAPEAVSELLIKHLLADDVPSI